MTPLRRALAGRDGPDARREARVAVASSLDAHGLTRAAADALGIGLGTLSRLVAADPVLAATERARRRARLQLRETRCRREKLG